MVSQTSKFWDVVFGTDYDDADPRKSASFLLFLLTIRAVADLARFVDTFS